VVGFLGIAVAGMQDALNSNKHAPCLLLSQADIPALSAHLSPCPSFTLPRLTVPLNHVALCAAGYVSDLVLSADSTRGLLPSGVHVVGFCDEEGIRFR
jgi:hypothetical protein